MKCTVQNCPLNLGNVEKCTVHNCEHRTKHKTDKNNYIRINGAWVEWEDSVEDLLEIIELSPDPVVAAFNITKEKLEGD